MNTIEVAVMAVNAAANTFFHTTHSSFTCLRRPQIMHSQTSLKRHVLHLRTGTCCLCRGRATLQRGGCRGRRRAFAGFCGSCPREVVLAEPKACQSKRATGLRCITCNMKCARNTTVSELIPAKNCLIICRHVHFLQGQRSVQRHDIQVARWPQHRLDVAVVLQ